MSAMKNLDLIVKNISMDPDEYNENVELVNAHIQGELKLEELPQHLQSAVVQWENEELELETKENYHDIQAWEDYT